MRGLPLVVVVSGCTFSGANAVHDAQGNEVVADARDASVGTEAPPPDALQLCWTAGTETICFTAPPTGTIDISTTNLFDTDTGAATTATGGLVCAITDTPSVCVVAGKTITIEAGVILSAVGAKPLVMVATSSVTIAGTLDVSANILAAKVGAGAKPPTPLCVNGMDPGGGHGGGGQGGSFGTLGGAGGDGTQTNNSGGKVGAEFTAPLTIRGGCPGGDGEGTGGSGAIGGGAAIIFGSTITITGAIDASGAGGAGGKKAKGGGGGGSGGLIILDAQTITVPGQLFANGGGGGGGGDNATTNNLGGPGLPSTSPSSKPTGGSGAASNDGGDGFFLRSMAPVQALPGTQAQTNTDGGGAGGGGAGVIQLIGAANPAGGSISPPPTPP